MRTIKYTKQYKKDFKNEKKSSTNTKSLERALLYVVKRLIEDKPLSKRYYDHALTGNGKDHRDCHIKPDLILIYRKPDPTTLELVRLGSHSKLSL